MVCRGYNDASGMLVAMWASARHGCPLPLTGDYDNPLRALSADLGALQSTVRMRPRSPAAGRVHWNGETLLVNEPGPGKAVELALRTISAQIRGSAKPLQSKLPVQLQLRGKLSWTWGPL